MAEKKATKTDVKSGGRTTEFWLSMLAVVAPIFAALADKIDGTAAVICSAIAAAGYAISRGMAKTASK